MKYFAPAILLFLLPFTSRASISPITGSTVVCASDITHLSDATAGGAWSSSNTSIASVDASGNVLGYSTGTATITYTVGAGFVTTSVIITPGISSVTGPSDLCFGTTQTFADSTSGGIWTSSNTLIAEVGSTSGIVTAIAQGAVVISYTSGSCYAAKATEISAPPVTLVGCDNVGVGDSLAFYGIASDTTYLFSSDNTIASYDFPSGKVVGVDTGIATITLLNPTTGCTVATRDITVTATAMILPITGNILVCSGSSSTLTDAAPGGAWGSSNTLIATVSAAGVVHALSGGEITVTYTIVSAGDTDRCTIPFFSNSLPSPISGPSSVCVADTIILTSGIPGTTRLAPADIASPEWYYFGSVPGGYAPGNSGAFTSSDSAKATVAANIYTGGVTTTGYIKGISGGLVAITFTDSYTGCVVTRPVTVNTPPVIPPITGPAGACVTGTATLSNALTGGVWSTSTSYIATIDSFTGFITALALGTDTISYFAANGCGASVRKTLFTVSGTPPPVPGAITGQNAVCMGASVTLHDTTVGGTWNSSTPGIATINSVTGVVTSVAPGTTVIIYTATNSCGSTYITANETVNPVPSAITGATGICMGATTTLHDSVAGGTWSSGSVWVANIVPGSGLLSGIGIGTAIITYTVGGALCRTTATVTVNTLPAVFSVSGGGGYCMGGAGLHIFISSSVSGFNYQLYRYGVAVGGAVPGTGVMLDMGLETVAGVYTVVAINPLTGCTANMSGSATITVNPPPPVYAVSGGGSYCAGGTGFHVFLVGSHSGIDYQLYNGTTMIGPSVSGTGSALTFGPFTDAGAYRITAINTTTGCADTMGGAATITVNTLPAVYTLTGGGGYCAGGPGVHIGVDSSNTGISYQLYYGAASLGSAVTGINAPLDFGLETAVGTYTIKAVNTTTGCTSNMSDTDAVTIYPLPLAYPVSGGGSYCAGGTGFHILLGGSQNDVTYQLYDTTATGSPLSGTGTSLDYGLHTAAGVYTVIATDVVTGCTRDMVSSALITIDPGPIVYDMAGGGSYCSGGTGVYIGLDGSEAGTQYQLFYGITATGIPAIGTGGAVDFGLETVAGSYTVVATNPATTCVANMSGSETVSVNISPSVITGFDTVTIGGTTTLSDAVTGGAWSSTEAFATVGLTTGIVTGDSLGRDTIIYTLPTGCSALIVVTVDPAVIPVISGVKPLAPQGELSIFPNPSSGNLNIKWQNAAAGTAAIVITDMAGRVVYRSDIAITTSSGDTQVSLDDFKNGIYLLTISNEHINYNSKLVIER